MIKENKNIFIVMLLLAVFTVSYTPKFSSLTKEKILIGNKITIDKYFSFLDSIVLKYDSLTPYPLTEHLLVRANPWIIDTLKNTDYYIQKSKNKFVYDQKKMIVFKKGDVLILPDAILAKTIIRSFQNTKIDINIPEFTLRIFEDATELFKFPIRVGRDEKKYLEMSGRVEDLKTKKGKGKIVGYNRYPAYYNPINNQQYFVTKRDDAKVTKLPQIPFIETEINGFKYGQMIHPTTNPATLGKAVSNGCIGTSEENAWVIYYYAPMNTKINIRYNLNIKDNNGSTIVLKDIYNYAKKQ